MEDGSGVIQVSGNANSWEQISLPGLPVNASGYFLTYVSNEQGQPVWFDNIAITYTKGRLLEEQNYYPHGLLSQSSTTAAVDPENQYKHQGKLLQEELGMQLYDFHARQYDPQIGRFWGIDPMDQFPSGYTGMGNDPANMIDPSGMLGTLFYATGDMTPNHPFMAANSQARKEAASAAWQEMLAVEAANSPLTNELSMGSDVMVDGEMMFQEQINEFAAFEERAYEMAAAELRIRDDRGVNQVSVNGTPMQKDKADEIVKGAETREEAEAALEAANYQADPDPQAQGAWNEAMMNEGGSFDNFEDFKEFMHSAANNAVNSKGERCEVGAYQMKDGTYNILPWKDNIMTKTETATFLDTKEIVAHWHTHPGVGGMGQYGNGSSLEDAKFSRDYKMKVYVITQNRALWVANYINIKYITAPTTPLGEYGREIAWPKPKSK